MIVALIGCHGAGKTTLGRALAERLRWPLHHEIGERLAADPRHRAAAVTAADPQEAFDDTVLREELLRDAAWDPRRHRLVETWHPGNLAYAAARSPRVAQRYIERVAASIARQPSAVIDVTAPAELLAARKTEPGAPGFFVEIGAAARDWAARLGLPTLAIVHASGLTASQAAAQIAPAVLAFAARTIRREG